MQNIISWATTDALIAAEFGTIPQGVEVCRRIDGSRSVFVIINHGRTKASMVIPAGAHDALQGGREETASIGLEPQGVAVIESESH
jgi:beta-galactosidase GanA